MKESDEDVQGGHEEDRDSRQEEGGRGKVCMFAEGEERGVEGAGGEKEGCIDRKSVV